MTTPTLSSSPTIASSPRGAIYLPSVHSDALVAPQGQADDKARAIFQLMRDHPLQGRVGMAWDTRLASVAAVRCVSQAHAGWTGHVDPQGYGPNWWVYKLGYKLPDWYPVDGGANNIESLAHAGDGDVGLCWQGWLDSPSHRVHVLGSNSFYASQVCVGVGYYSLEGSEYGYYWSIISAPKEEG